MDSCHRTTFVASFCAFLFLALPVRSFAQVADASVGRAAPLGYREVDTARGVTLWRKNREYVQVVSPRRGGRIKLLIGDVKPSEIAGTAFERKDIRDWWDTWATDDGDAFSVVNGQFFNMTDPAKAPIAFSAKIDGVVHPGYGDNIEYPQGKLVLLLDENGYDVRPYADDAGTLFVRNELEALVGLKPDMSKSASARMGRTFVGIAPNGNAIVFTSPGATQRYATRILLAFGADRQKIIMLDGGGSTQLVADGKLLAPSKRGAALRTVPQAIGIAGGKNSRE
jgi:hypothetical protein